MIFWNWSYLIVVSKTAFCVVIASLFLTSCAVPPTKPVSQAPKVSSPSNLSRTPKVTETVVTDDSSSSAALTPVEFSEIPGWDEDKLSEAWQAWLQSCSVLRNRKPGPVNWLRYAIERTLKNREMQKRFLRIISEPMQFVIK